VVLCKGGTESNSKEQQRGQGHLKDEEDMKTRTPSRSPAFKAGFHAKLVSGALHALHERR
jgi:hypothetical protein